MPSIDRKRTPPAYTGIAKIDRPRLGRILVRPQLIDALAAAERPVIWIDAVPGAGKTSLINSYIETKGLHSLWYEVDSGDSDPGSFFYYLGLAVAKAAADQDFPLPVLTPEYMLGMAIFARRFFEALATRVQPPFILVFDNYHELADDSVIHGLICEALKALPEGFTTVFISRREPPPAFAPLLVQRRITRLPAASLSLSLEECHKLAELAKTPTDERFLVRIQRETQGWAAGVILALEQKHFATDAKVAVLAKSCEAVFNYFASEIYNSMDSRTKNALTASALFPKMTAPLLDELTGSREAAHLVEDLYRRNYFTVGHQAGEMEYQFHPLFREFLLAQGKLDYKAEELIVLRQRAAILLESAGETSAAIDLYYALQDWPRLEALILKSCPELLAQGCASTLDSWIKSLPTSYREGSPWILYWTGMCCLAMDPLAAKKEFEKAFHLFESRGDTTGTLLSWCAVIDAYQFAWGEFVTSDRWIDWMDKWLERGVAYPSAEIEARVAASLYSAIMFRSPQHPKQADLANRLMTFLHNCSDPVRCLALGSALMHSCIWYGDFFNGRITLVAMDHAGPQATHAPSMQIWWKISSAAYASISMDFESALGCVEQALQLAESTGVFVFDMSTLMEGVFAAARAGQFERAENYLARARERLNPARQLEVGQFHYISGALAFAKGARAQAREHVSLASRLARQAGTPFPQALSCLALIETALAEGDYQQAETDIREALPICAATGEFVQYKLDLLRARCAFDQGNRHDGLIPLRAALAIARRKGYVFHDFWSTPSLAGLYAEALQADIETDYVRSAIRQNAIAPLTDCTIEAWPWPLRIYTLGQFQIIRDEERIVSSGKAQRKVFDLLKAIIAFGGEGVHEQQLSMALWPDADGDNAHQALTITLHRLRKLVGKQAILVYDKRLSLNRAYAWVDFLACNRLLDEVESGGASSAIVESKIETAIALNRGEFLDEDLAWAREPYMRLRGKLLRHTRRCGERKEAAGELEAAVDWYERALAIDPLAKPVYCRLMQCFSRVGKEAELEAVYRRCEHNFSTLKGGSPSLETQVLYRSLAKNTASNL